MSAQALGPLTSKPSEAKSHAASKQNMGSYGWGFITRAAVAPAMLVAMRLMQVRRTRTWADGGGRARVHGLHAPNPVVVAMSGFESRQGVQP